MLRTSYGIIEIKCSQCENILYNVEQLRELKTVELTSDISINIKLDLNSFSNFNMICKCKNCGNEIDLSK